MNTSKLDMVNSDLMALLDLLGELESAEPVAEPVADLVADLVAEEPLVDEAELSATVRK